jgi:hypothetical protein
MVHNVSGAVETRGLGGWEAHVPGELLVGLRSFFCEEEGISFMVEKLFSSPEVQILSALPQLGIWRVAVPVGQEMALLKTWRSNQCVAFVELNYPTDVVQ